jgi:hypothetical protein
LDMRAWKKTGANGPTGKKVFRVVVMWRGRRQQCPAPHPSATSLPPSLAPLGLLTPAMAAGCFARRG